MPKKSDVIERLKLLRSKGATLGEIAQTLNKEGYRTPARKKKFTSSYVNWILNQKQQKRIAAGTAKEKEQEEKLPTRLIKNILNDDELTDKQKVAVLKSFYGN